MNYERLRSILIDSGFQPKTVDRLLGEYQKMHTRFQEQEYDEVGVHVGKFCEAVVYMLRLQISSEITSETVREFAASCLNGDYAEEYSLAIRQHIPNMLHTAYDIRSNRDAAHLNLKTAVNRSDAQLGIALSSSILVELIQEFVEYDEFDNPDKIIETINQLSEIPAESPLQALVRSKYEINGERMVDVLDSYITIVEEDADVQPGPEFFDLNREQQVIALALGRLAAYNLEYTDRIAQHANWFEERTSYEDRIKKKLQNIEFIQQNNAPVGYYIPAYQVDNAADQLPDDN